MSVAKVTEIIASSNKGFDDAITNGIKRANKTLKNIKGAWVRDPQLTVNDGKITESDCITTLVVLLFSKLFNKLNRVHF